MCQTNRKWIPFISLSLVCLLLGVASPVLSDEEVPNARRPQSDSEMRYWLENMISHHHFTDEEVRLATGLTLQEIRNEKARLGIMATPSGVDSSRETLKVLPYPGGRHPRIGFLEGAIQPQRETKVSVFLPWPDSGYVVADVPEAIWSNLGLTYLAHTHIDTIWTKQGVSLPKLEWNRGSDGSFDLKRRLPNGIEFTTWVKPARDHVRMEMELVNGTDAVLSDLRVQNCIMLKAAPGFARQSNENKVFSGKYAAVHSDSGARWIITAWSPIQRAWGNEQCPCLHADPQFPDCPPGETRRLVGWLSFYEGDDVRAEFQRLDALNWKQPQLSNQSSQ